MDCTQVGTRAWGQDTIKNLQAGKHVTGLPTLAKCIDKSVVDAVAEWLHLGRRDEEYELASDSRRTEPLFAQFAVSSQLRIPRCSQKSNRERKDGRGSRAACPGPIGFTPQQQTNGMQTCGFLTRRTAPLICRTGKIRAHQPEDYLTKSTAAVGPSTADCPKWKAHLHRVLNADPETDSLSATDARVLSNRRHDRTCALLLLRHRSKRVRASPSTRSRASSKTTDRRRASRRSRQAEMIVTYRAPPFCEAQGWLRFPKRKKGADAPKAG